MSRKLIARILLHQKRIKPPLYFLGLEGRFILSLFYHSPLNQTNIGLNLCSKVISIILVVVDQRF